MMRKLFRELCEEEGKVLLQKVVASHQNSPPPEKLPRLRVIYTPEGNIARVQVCHAKSEMARIGEDVYVVIKREMEKVCLQYCPMSISISMSISNLWHSYGLDMLSLHSPGVCYHTQQSLFQSRCDCVGHEAIRFESMRY